MTVMAEITSAPPGLDARTRILRAAEQLFGDKGYAATSVQEITVAADVNKALLYYYFEDKHSLYVSLIDSGIGEFEQMLDEALSQPGSYAERLRAFVAGHARLLWTRSDVVRVVQRCLLAGEQEEVGLAEKFSRLLGRLEEFFADAITAGAFRPVDPRMAALSTVSITDKFACAQMFRGPQNLQFTQEQVVAHVTDLLLKGLIRQ